MFDCCWSLILSFWDEIDFLFGLIHELARYFVNPFGNCCWKHKILSFLFSLIFNKIINIFNIKFKTFFEHLICLIDTSCLKFSKVYTFSFNEIHKSAWSSNNNIDSISQFTNLIIDWSTSIYCNNIEIVWVVLKTWNLFINLWAKLSCWTHDKKLDLLSSTFKDSSIS